MPAENLTKGSIADKFLKCITISDSQSENSSIVNSAEVWVQFQWRSLTIEDKRKIENGSKLTDKHVNFTNSMISCQFPNIGGLWSTLLRSRYYCFSLHSIQQIFCKEQEHWIVASNIMQTSDHKTTSIHVYDSLFRELDQESHDLILQNFHARNNDRRTTIVMKELQNRSDQQIVWSVFHCCYELLGSQRRKSK